MLQILNQKTFNIRNPQYKKNGIFQSLTLKIVNQDGDLVKDSLGINVVLHIPEGSS